MPLTIRGITKLQKEQLEEFFNSKKDFFLKTKKVDYKKIAPEFKKLVEKVKMEESKVKAWMISKKQKEKCKDSETDNVVAGPSQPSGVLVSKYICHTTEISLNIFHVQGRRSGLKSTSATSGHVCNKIIFYC